MRPCWEPCWYWPSSIIGSCRWERWLDDAASWTPFFEQVAALDAPNLAEALDSLDLVSQEARRAVEALQIQPGDRSVALPAPFTGTAADLDTLAMAFSRSSQGSLVVPYAALGDESS